MGKDKKLTTTAGCPVAHNQNVMTAGPRGPQLTPAQQTVLFENTARSLGDAPREIKVRHIGNCLKANPAYGKGVADALKIPLSDVSA